MSFRRSFEIVVARREIAEARVARGLFRYLPPLIPWFGLGVGLAGALVHALHAQVIAPLAARASPEACTRFVEEHFEAFATTYRCYAELAIGQLSEPMAALDEPARAVLALNRQRPLDDYRDEQLARSYRAWTAAYALGLLVLSVESRTTAAATCAVEMARTGRLNSDIALEGARSLRRVRRAGAA